eukprot:TRINITY_DN16402_c0_g1_i1.p1 TRINITY_DN16402_c0_g1~~TRINITY_DN16402_c0_g1_i1.p1  ORF type:complete len:917 (+),score=112.12 TRINITY_DN16402_c0_g1_i1:89-2839(+)
MSLASYGSDSGSNSAAGAGLSSKENDDSAGDSLQAGPPGCTPFHKTVKRSGESSASQESEPVLASLGSSTPSVDPAALRGPTVAQQTTPSPSGRGRAGGAEGWAPARRAGAAPAEPPSPAADSGHPQPGSAARQPPGREDPGGGPDGRDAELQNYGSQSTMPESVYYSGNDSVAPSPPGSGPEIARSPRAPGTPSSGTSPRRACLSSAAPSGVISQVTTAAPSSAAPSVNFSQATSVDFSQATTAAPRDSQDAPQAAGGRWPLRHRPAEWMNRPIKINLGSGYKTPRASPPPVRDGRGSPPADRPAAQPAPRRRKVWGFAIPSPSAAPGPEAAGAVCGHTTTGSAPSAAGSCPPASPGAQSASGAAQPALHWRRRSLWATPSAASGRSTAAAPPTEPAAFPHSFAWSHAASGLSESLSDFLDPHQFSLNIDRASQCAGGEAVQRGAGDSPDERRSPEAGGSGGNKGERGAEPPRIPKRSPRSEDARSERQSPPDAPGALRCGASFQQQASEGSRNPAGDRSERAAELRSGRPWPNRSEEHRGGKEPPACSAQPPACSAQPPASSAPDPTEASAKRKSSGGEGGLPHDARCGARGPEAAPPRPLKRGASAPARAVQRPRPDDAKCAAPGRTDRGPGLGIRAPPSDRGVSCEGRGRKCADRELQAGRKAAAGTASTCAGIRGYHQGSLESSGGSRKKPPDGSRPGANAEHPAAPKRAMRSAEHNPGGGPRAGLPEGEAAPGARAARGSRLDSRGTSHGQKLPAKPQPHPNLLGDLKESGAGTLLGTVPPLSRRPGVPAGAGRGKARFDPRDTGLSSLLRTDKPAAGPGAVRTSAPLSTSTSAAAFARAPVMPRANPGLGQRQEEGGRKRPAGTGENPAKRYRAAPVSAGRPKRGNLFGPGRPLGGGPEHRRADRLNSL